MPSSDTDDGAGLADGLDEVGAGPGLAVGDVEHRVVEAGGDQVILQRPLVLEVELGRAALDLVERRLGDEDVAALDQLRHLAEEEGEQQGADMGAVDIGVGHDDDLVVAQLVGVELVLADAGAERGDQRADLLGAEHLVEARPLDIEDLAAQRQHRLVSRDGGPAWPSRRPNRPRR